MTKDINLSTNILRSKEYFDQLTQTFPNLKEIDLDDGDHWCMERFADYTIEQINNSNWDQLKDCFEFQEQRIKILSSDLENALNVSYCESMLLGGLKPELLSKAIDIMGPFLKQVYLDYEVYYKNLSKGNN